MIDVGGIRWPKRRYDMFPAPRGLGYHAFGAPRGVCPSAGPCRQCWVDKKDSVPLVSMRKCYECGSESHEALTIGCCEATDEDMQALRSCERCRRVAELERGEVRQ